MGAPVLNLKNSNENSKEKVYSGKRLFSSFREFMWLLYIILRRWGFSWSNASSFAGDLSNRGMWKNGGVLVKRKKEWQELKHLRKSL